MPQANISFNFHVFEEFRLLNTHQIQLDSRNSQNVLISFLGKQSKSLRWKIRASCGSHESNCTINSNQMYTCRRTKVCVTSYRLYFGQFLEEKVLILSSLINQWLFPRYFTGLASRLKLIKWR